MSHKPVDSAHAPDIKSKLELNSYVLGNPGRFWLSKALGEKFHGDGGGDCENQFHDEFSEARITGAPPEISVRQSLTEVCLQLCGFLDRPYIEVPVEAVRWISDSADLLKMRLC